MSKTILYEIEFLSDWHSGSGLSAGADIDTVPIKDNYGLPYLPGRTVKGLLAHAAEYISTLNSSLVTKEFRELIFGIGTGEAEEDWNTTQGQVFFSNAELPKGIKAHLANKENLKSQLYTRVSSTKINEHGVAEDNTLRSMQTTVPLTLEGSISFFPEDTKALEQLTYCMQWVKRLGLGRSRGLGKCTFKIK